MRQTQIARRRRLVGYIDSSVTVTGKRGRPPADVVEALNGPTDTQDRRYRVDGRRLAFFSR